MENPWFPWISCRFSMLFPSNTVEIHGSAGPLGAAGAATTALSMAADWSTPLGEHLTQGDPRWGVPAGHCWVVVSIVREIIPQRGLFQVIEML